MRALAVLTSLAILTAAPARAQSAANVLVVINGNSPASIEVGEYYARARGVPADQVARLETSSEETVSFADYVSTIEAPLATWITTHRLYDRILYIVLTKGVPIRVRGTGGREGSVASVDSELTLLYRKLVGTPTTSVGRIDNPYFLGEQPIDRARPFTRADHDIYLVTRLDGFTVADVVGLIDRAQRPSREGRIVLDQRGQLLDSGGDRWLQQAADRLEGAGAGDRVLLENSRELAATDAPVLGYYSWGSNDAAYRRRAPGLTFAPGAIAGWFVSTDGRTFVEPPEDWVPGPTNRPPGPFGSGSQSVAADLVRDGVTGMSAHVSEPYLDATIRPQILFPAYVSGLNLAESYYLAMPFLSWQTIVIGDPLTAPFRTEVVPKEAIDSGLDPATELPALFAERRLNHLATGGLDRTALQYLLRSGVRRDADDEAGSEELLRQTVEREPRLTAASLQLAGIYEERKEYDRAIGEYRRIVSVSPRNAVALNNLAYGLAVHKGELNESLALAKTAYSLSDLPTIADTLGWIHHLRGDHAAARPLFEAAVTRAPDNAVIHLHAAFVHAALGEVTRARTLLETALKLDAALAEQDDVKALRQKIGS